MLAHSLIELTAVPLAECAFLNIFACCSDGAVGPESW